MEINMNNKHFKRSSFEKGDLVEDSFGHRYLLKYYIDDHRGWWADDIPSEIPDFKQTSFISESRIKHVYTDKHVPSGLTFDELMLSLNTDQ